MNLKINVRNNTKKSYFLHFLTSSLIHLIVSLLVQKYGQKYGLLSSLYEGEQYLKFTTNFDGIHYLFNEYTHLMNFVFLPGFSVPVNKSNHYFLHSLSLIFIVNKILFWLSVWKLQKICSNLSIKKTDTHRIVLLYIYNPAAVFFHSIYSESFYSALTFTFIELETRRKKTFINTIFSVFLLILAVLVRSTALFLLPVIGIPILRQLYDVGMKKKMRESLILFYKGFNILFVCVGIFFLYLFLSSKRICQSLRPLPQCKNNFFNIYSFAQQNYWNVGFLTYFELKNLVFILIGLPSIIFSAIFFKFQNFKTIHANIHLSFLLLMIVTISMTNIQSSTRFLCSHPAFYLNAILYMKDSFGVLKFLIKKLFEIWQICYFLIGILLFALQFPWT